MKLHTCLAVVLSACAIALPAATPDAGQLLRDQQPQRTRKPVQELPSAESPLATDVQPELSGPTVIVNGIRFSGYEGLATEDELQQTVQDAIGVKTDVAGLQRLADRITAVLRSKGFFLARAYLPRQDVTSGVIEIAIIQARSDGGVTINRAAGSRIQETKLKQIVESVIRPGQPLLERDLERALLLMNDLPGITARAVLAPGSAPGTTRITINASERNLLSGSLWADNHGNRYTGAWRGNGLISVSDPFGWGDQISIMASGAKGLAQGRASYALPIGTRGLRGDVSFTAMQYELGEELSVLNAKGSAQTFNAGVSYPLVRQRATSIYATSSYEFKGLVDKAYGFTIRDKVLHSGSAGVYGDRSDGLGGGGYNTWSASMSGGNLDLSGNRSDEQADKAGPRTAGSYVRLNIAASRLQRITGGLMFSASYAGQFTPDNLDSSEKFSLGGPYGVRAFPVGEASGDQGHLLNLELRKELIPGWKWGNVQAIGFLDTGHTTLDKKPWTATASTRTGKNSYWLSGTGVGFSVSQPGRYSVRLSYAHKLGGNPGRSLNGMDADGRDSAGRFWAMAQFVY